MSGCSFIMAIFHLSVSLFQSVQMTCGVNYKYVALAVFLLRSCRVFVNDHRNIVTNTSKLV